MQAEAFLENRMNGPSCNALISTHLKKKSKSFYYRLKADDMLEKREMLWLRERFRIFC